MQDINKMQDENLDFIEIQNNNQNARWDVSEEKKQRKKLKFSSQPTMSLVFFFGCVLHVFT